MEDATACRKVAKVLREVFVDIREVVRGVREPQGLGQPYCAVVVRDAPAGKRRVAQVRKTYSIRPWAWALYWWGGPGA